MREIPAREHDIEPVPGLPERLPAGETMLWQGRPAARLVAMHLLKSRWLAAYFLVLALWAGASGFYDGQQPGGILFSLAVLIALGAALLALVELYAWAIWRTTIYTITDRRVVMRFGVAFSMALNLPYGRVDGVSMRPLGGKGAGTIAIRLAPGHRLSWLIQWPHARGWRFAQTEPALICLPDAEAASAALALAITRYRERHGAALRAVPERPTVADMLRHAPAAAE